ncbi:MAG: FG-GAP repeat domain-containing protein [Bradymonadia bacterium]
MRLLPLLPLLLPLFTGCDTLEGVDRLRCGNGLVEPSANEDCDGLPEGSPYACGAPGSEAACKLVCTDIDGEPICPDGWACGSDGVCRAPSGRFDSPTLVGIDGRPLYLEDMDGDTYIDLVAQELGEVQVAYGSPQGFITTPVHTLTPPPLSDVVVGDATGDGLADVFMDTEIGLLILQGSRERLLTPKVVSDLMVGDTPRIAESLRVRAPFTLTEQLMLVGPDSPWNRVGPSTLDVSGIQEQLSLRNRQLERLAVGDLDRTAADDVPTADELIFGASNTGSIWVLAFDCPADDGECTATVRQTLQLPQMLRLTRSGTFLGDLDADGDLDLIASAARAGDAAVPIVAFNNGNGRFDDLQLFEPLNRDMMCENCALRDFDPSAVGDLNGDGFADVLSAGNVEMSRGGDPLTFEQVYQLGGPLQGANTADLNNDGFEDFYGNRPDSIVFLFGGPEGFVTSVSPRAPAGANYIAGDFDGDHRTDVAIMQGSGDVEILFGSAEGLPDERVFVGHIDDVFGETISLLAAQRPITDNGQLDIADELIIIVDNRQYTLLGDPGRLPRVLAPPEDRIQALFANDFPDFDPGVLAFTLVANQNLPTNVVYLDGETLSETPVERNDCDAFIDSPSAPVTRIDLDGDGTDEIILTSRREPGQGMTAQAQIQVFRILDGQLRCDSAFSRLAEAQVAAASVAGDFDLDGTRELMTLYRPIGSTTDVEQVWSLSIWPLNPERPLLPPEPRQLVIPASDGLTSLNLGDEGPSLLTSQGGVLTRMRFVGGAVGFDDLFPVTNTLIESLHTADLNLDGVDDLVVKAEDSALIYLQRPCEARDVAAGACRRPSPF